MATRVVADDGLPAEQVGVWAKDKHAYLCRYLDASRSARKKYVGPGKAGATFVDLFCSFGRSKIRDTGEFVDGSPVAAWKASSGGPAPFSRVHIADVDADAVDACKQRLERLGAPVVVHVGNAVSAAREYVTHVSRSGLHLAFLDPYGIGQLDFRIIKELARLQRIDMLIHVSAMDLQRNLGGQIN